MVLNFLRFFCYIVERIPKARVPGHDNRFSDPLNKSRAIPTGAWSGAPPWPGGTSMSIRTRPPFRADHVGSFLRPPALLDAREQRNKGKISAAALREVE